MPVEGYVAYSPPGAEGLFRDLVLREIRLLPPRRIGLGYSLLHAADLIAAGYEGACLRLTSFHSPPECRDANAVTWWILP